MSTVVQITLEPSDEFTSKNHSARPRKNTLGDDIEGNTPTVNNVDALKQGFINTSKNKAKTPYTILLIGETGVGKSSVLELIANVITGKEIDDYDFGILDRTNEQSNLGNQTQTNSARLYELTSNNGIVIRILDTPGLADTGDLRQDELHKKSVTTQIKNHIDCVTAVLVLTNGTVPGATVGTHHALSTLSTIFPTTLANNLAFVLTNVPDPLYQNFSGGTLPDVLKDAPQFLLDNPIALQRKYLKLEGDIKTKSKRAEMRKTVKAGEEKALEMLVDLFDWLDGLERQPTTESMSLYEGALRKVEEEGQEGVQKFEPTLTGQ